MKTIYWLCYTLIRPSSPQTARLLETTGRKKSEIHLHKIWYHGDWWMQMLQIPCGPSEEKDSYLV